jgi:hypothetical protein
MKRDAPTGARGRPAIDGNRSAHRSQARRAWNPGDRNSACRTGGAHVGRDVSVGAAMPLRMAAVFPHRYASVDGVRRIPC